MRHCTLLWISNKVHPILKPKVVQMSPCVHNTLPCCGVRWECDMAVDDNQQKWRHRRRRQSKDTESKSGIYHVEKNVEGKTNHN